MKDVLYPLRLIHGRIDTLYKNYKYYTFLKSKKYSVILIETPEHTNIGDNAIALAEIIYLKRNLEKGKLIEITYNEYLSYKKGIDKYFDNIDSVFLHGGGNMGDEWYNEELLRREIITKAKKKKVVFPQTFYYSNTENGNKKKSESKDIYNNFNLTVIAREKKSYLDMREIYPDANILLTPDIVLSTTMNDYGVIKQDRNGVMFCVRHDAEKSVDDSLWDDLNKYVVNKGYDSKFTDMHTDAKVTKENRLECVRKKMQEFCDAKLVVTDRLHAMIFSAITETPCVVFSNYNHKVKGTYEWIKYLPYIRYVENINEAKNAIDQLLKMNSDDCHFDNSKLLPLYKPLEKIIKENINS